MEFLDMFDKLDDIVYEPVKAICEWAKEPLRILESKRNAKNEAEAKKLDQELAQKSQREAAELDADIRRWNVEIDNMIADKEMERHDRLVEALKQYQIDLAKAAKDMALALNNMQVEIRDVAGKLIDQRTQTYKKMQDEIKASTLKELSEAKEMFFDSDPDTYKMLREQIIEERKTMIEQASIFIKELAEDSKRLSISFDDTKDQSQKYIFETLKSLAGKYDINPRALETDEIKLIK